MSISMSLVKLSAVMALALTATVGDAQTRSDTRQYLNTFCLSQNIYFHSGSRYYHRYSNSYRFTDMSKVRPQTVTGSTTEIRFNCNGTCRYSRDTLSGPSRTFTSLGIWRLKSGLSATQRAKCRRAVRHLAVSSGATTIDREMF